MQERRWEANAGSQKEKEEEERESRNLSLAIRFGRRAEPKKSVHPPLSLTLSACEFPCKSEKRRRGGKEIDGGSARVLFFPRGRLEVGGMRYMEFLACVLPNASILVDWC